MKVLGQPMPNDVPILNHEAMPHFKLLIMNEMSHQTQWMEENIQLVI